MKKHLLLSVILGLATITALPVSAMHRHRSDVLSIDDAAGSSSAASSSSVVPYVYQAPQKIDPARAQAEMDRSLKECDELLDQATAQGKQYLTLSNRFFETYGPKINEGLRQLTGTEEDQKRSVVACSNERLAALKALEALQTKDSSTFLDPSHSAYLTLFEKLYPYTYIKLEEAADSEGFLKLLGNISVFLNQDSFGTHSTLAADLENTGRRAFRSRNPNEMGNPVRSRFLIEASEEASVALLWDLHIILTQKLQEMGKTRGMQNTPSNFYALVSGLNQTLTSVQTLTKATYRNAVTTTQKLIGAVSVEELRPVVQNLAKLHDKLRAVQNTIAAAQRRSVHGSSALVRSEETEKKTDLLLAVAHLATLDDAAVRADTTEASLVRRDIRLVAKTLGSEGAPLLGIDSRSKITVTVEQMREAFFGALRTLDLEVYGERNRMYFRRATPQRALAITSAEQQLAVQAAIEARSAASGSGSANHPHVEEVD